MDKEALRSIKLVDDKLYFKVSDTEWVSEDEYDFENDCRKSPDGEIKLEFV